MSAARRPALIREDAAAANFAPFDLSAVTSFHRSLPGYEATPLIALPDVADQLGLKGVYIKDESDRFGLPSFKILGASWGTFCAITAALGLPLSCDLAELTSEARRAGLVLFAATDGNHGRAVAFMAKLLSIEARVFVPCSLDEHTSNKISGGGAQVIVGQGDYDDVVQCAAEAAGELSEGVLVQDTSFPGYEETPARIVEGYYTVFKEIDDQMAKLGLSCDTIISPVGVGSLALTVVRHFKSRGRHNLTKVVAVESGTAACLYSGLQSSSDGPSPTIRTSDTIMAGLDCGTVSLTAWPDLRSYIDGSVTVSDFEAYCAVQDLAVHGLNSGPCGASGLAALRYLAASYRDQIGLNNDAVVILLNTEGNRPYVVPHDVSSEDPKELTRILTRIELASSISLPSRGQWWTSHRTLHRLVATASEHQRSLPCARDWR